MLNKKFFSLLAVSLALTACQERGDSDNDAYFHEEGTQYLSSSDDEYPRFETYRDGPDDYVEWYCTLDAPYDHLRLRLSLPYLADGYAMLENLQTGAGSLVVGPWSVDGDDLLITDASSRRSLLALNDYQFSGQYSFSATLDLEDGSSGVATRCVLIDQDGYTF
ncbi:hypothetical protein Q4485_01705 [Granulosicoccaceae sp. 1_MG-2023]|nr:hypothetical protein [Granulosicoccaceae sp. 1_MG-2023]